MYASVINWRLASLVVHSHHTSPRYLKFSMQHNAETIGRSIKYVTLRENAYTAFKVGMQMCTFQTLSPQRERIVAISRAERRYTQYVIVIGKY